MKTNQLQSEISSLIEELGKLDKLIDEKENTITLKGRELLNELRKLDNWEVLIDCCKEHYEKYPDQFFNWCHVKYNKHKVSFVKNYSDDDDDYYVLTIDLTKTLEEQIKERELKNKKEYEQKKVDTREKELAELKRLKEKYENK